MHPKCKLYIKQTWNCKMERQFWGGVFVFCFWILSCPQIPERTVLLQLDKIPSYALLNANMQELEVVTGSLLLHKFNPRPCL